MPVMYMGRLCEVGSVDAQFAPPYHSYTEALRSAIPLPDPRSVQRKIWLEGPVPSPVDPGPGFRFHSRCPRKLGAVCVTVAPPAREAAPGHVIVCHIPLEEFRRVPPVIEDGHVVAAPPGGP
jgi:peptide/nickel transport system ATP-binding protein